MITASGQWLTSGCGAGRLLRAFVDRGVDDVVALDSFPASSDGYDEAVTFVDGHSVDTERPGDRGLSRLRARPDRRLVASGSRCHRARHVRHRTVSVRVDALPSRPRSPSLTSVANRPAIQPRSPLRCWRRTLTSCRPGRVRMRCLAAAGAMTSPSISMPESLARWGRWLLLLPSSYTGIAPIARSDEPSSHSSGWTARLRITARLRSARRRARLLGGRCRSSSARQRLLHVGGSAAWREAAVGSIWPAGCPTRTLRRRTWRWWQRVSRRGRRSSTRRSPYGSRIRCTSDCALAVGARAPSDRSARRIGSRFSPDGRSG